MMAKELAEKRVLVQTQVTSTLAWQAVITQAIMSAPAGYEVQQIGSEIFPLQVQNPSAPACKDRNLSRTIRSICSKALHSALVCFSANGSGICCW